MQAQALQQQQQLQNKTGRLMDLQGSIGLDPTSQGMYGVQTSMGHGVGQVHGMGHGMGHGSHTTGLNPSGMAGSIGGPLVGGMGGLQGMGPIGRTQTSTAVSTATSGTSISGMLADFSRALGLGNTSPRPSPSEERPNMDPHDPLACLHPPPLYGSAGSTNTTTTPSIGGALGSTTHSLPTNTSSALTTGLTQQSIPSTSLGMGSQTNILAQQQLQQQVQQLAKQNQMQQQQQQQLQHQLQQQLQMQQEEQMQQQYMLQEQAHQTQILQQQLQQQAAQQQHVVQQVAQTAVQLQQQQHQQVLPDGTPILPLFPQHMTPQQQQMYQQQMQQQHQAQHLKKTRRSLPHQQQPNTMDMQLRQHQMGRTHTHLGTSQPVISGTLGSTPMSTPQGTPVGTPRGPRDQGGDSSDTLSETDSQKSLRMRRKLPAIPADQEAAPLPCTKKRDRKSHSADRFRSFSPLRQTSLDGSSARSSSLMLTRPSASETNLRKIVHGVDQTPRPGSALGLLQGSSVVSSTGLPVSTSSLYARNQMSDLASVLPPDLRHLLGPGAGGSVDVHSLNETYSKTTPSYMQSLKEQLKEEMRADRRRMMSLDKERELRFRREREKFEALRDPLKRLDMQRKMASPVLSRSRKLRAHRRQLSDPKIHPPFSPITEDRDLENEYERGYLGFLHKPPYKSYEYESIDDGHRSEWDPSHSYLSTSYAAAGGALRETAINSVLDDDRYFSSSRSGLRRSSDILSSRSLPRKPRKPRSWHPSPYGSDEDDDVMFREEKKAKIKAEIARRRREIEVNDRLHEELVRLAKIRESAELGYDQTGGYGNDLGVGRAGVGSRAGPSSADYASSSVLKSIDELLLTDPMDYSHHRSRSPRRHPGVSEEDRSIERIASTFRTDDYTSGLYERLSDFSPLTDFTPHAMPLLPDMPTRSRKLLEDLGSSPITESVLALPQKGKYGSRLYAK